MENLEAISKKLVISINNQISDLFQIEFEKLKNKEPASAKRMIKLLDKKINNFRVEIDLAPEGLRYITFYVIDDSTGKSEDLFLLKTKSKDVLTAIN